MKFIRIQNTTVFIFLLLLILSFSQAPKANNESNHRKSYVGDSVNILNKFSELTPKKSQQISIEDANKALKLAINKNDINLIATSYENIADISFSLGNTDTAIYFYKKSFEFSNQLDNSEGLIDIYIKLAKTYKRTGQIENAKMALKYSLGISEELSLSKKKAITLIRLAEIYYLQGDLTKAIISSFDALGLVENTNEKLTLFEIYINLGNIYLVLKDFERAYEFNSYALLLAEELNNTEKLIIANNNFCRFYLKLELVESADSCVKKAITIHNKKKTPFKYEYTLFNLGQILLYQNNYNSAIEIFNKSLKKSIEINDIYLIPENYMAIGNTYLLLGDIKLAREYLDKANTYLQEYSLLDEYYIYYLYSKMYEKNGKFQEALKFNQKYISAKDSILNSNMTNTVAKIKTTNDLHKQKDTISYLMQEKNSQEKQIENYHIIKNLSITGSSIILILLILLFFNNRNKIKANKILKEQNEEIIRKNVEIEEQTSYLTKLLEEHEKLSIAAKQTDNAITIISTEGKIEWINEGYTRLYGYTIDNLVAMKETTYADFSANPIAKEIFERAISEKKSQTFEADVFSKDKQKHRIQTTLTPILDDKNNIIKLIAIDSDVSKLKAIETELQKLLITKDKFFSIIAHDLKNPFNSLIGLSQLLDRGYDRMSTEKIKYFIANLYQISKNGYELLINLLEWSRSQMGSIAYTPIIVNLHAITEETFSLYGAKAIEKEILFTNSVHKDSFVFADQNMLKTIFRNLVSNALKFTDRGGVIEISEKEDDDFKEISIRDTGVGIKPEDIKKLFKLDDNFTTEGTEEESGTGLGLILCKEFIEKHGCKIWVESKLGSGSKFIFTLPSHKEI